MWFFKPSPNKIFSALQKYRSYKEALLAYPSESLQPQYLNTWRRNLIRHNIQQYVWNLS